MRSLTSAVIRLTGVFLYQAEKLLRRKREKGVGRAKGQEEGGGFVVEGAVKRSDKAVEARDPRSGREP